MLRRLLVVLAVAAIAAGCTSDPDPHPHRSAGPDRPPTLRTAWSTQPAELWDPSPTSTTPWAWSTATALIVPETKGLTSYSTTTGAMTWTLDLPAGVCSIAGSPNRDGVGAVLLGKGKGADEDACGAVAAVNTRTGRLLWTTSLAGLSRYGFAEVAIGDAAVAVTNPCDAAVTFAVRDGHRLASLSPGSGDGCAGSFASDGRTVVDATRRAGRPVLVGYDAVSGRRLWSVPVRPDARDGRGRPEIHRTISSDPLVAEVSIDSHRFLRRVDPAAGRADLFGREAHDSWVPVFTRPIGSRIVVQYGRSRTLFAYDAASGRETTHVVLAAGESAVGVRGDEVITVGAAAPASGRAADFVVRTVDPAAGTRKILGVGAIDGVSSTFGLGVGFRAAVSGNALVISHTAEIFAYRLPAGRSAVAEPADARHWAAGDVRPDKAVDLCTGVTTATKRALGFREPALPAPADCHWVEQTAGETVRQFYVTVWVAEPAGKQGAVTRARAEFARVSAADTTNHLPALTSIPGLGDEAAGTANGGDSHYRARVVVRRANVVFSVDAIGDVLTSSAGEATVLERGARRVAADLVAELGRRR